MRTRIKRTHSLLHRRDSLKYRARDCPGQLDERASAVSSECCALYVSHQSRRAGVAGNNRGFLPHILRDAKALDPRCVLINLGATLCVAEVVGVASILDISGYYWFEHLR